jgi:hypothetical protein
MIVNTSVLKLHIYVSLKLPFEIRGMLATIRFRVFVFPPAVEEFKS